MKFNIARRPPAREGGVSASAVAMLVSAALHGGAWAASGFALDRAGDQASPTSNVAVDFVLDVAEPSPEPVPAPEPVKTVSVARVRPVVPPTAVPSRDENVKEAAVPVEQSTDDVPSAGALAEGDGIVSTDGGLGVAVASGHGGGAGAPRAEPPAPTVDPRVLLRSWVKRVSSIVNAKASQDYPLAARRTRKEGLVVVGVVVDAQGHILSVEVKRSSGVEVLDGAALAALRDLGDVPAPPSVVDWRPRPLTLPIQYQLEVL